MHRLVGACLFAGLLFSPIHAQSRLTVDVDHPGPRISPTFYGLMTEEINHSYDGGLYAELIQNRSFADNPKTPTHWSLVTDPGAVADMRLDGGALKLHVSEAKHGSAAGVANDGYWGIPMLPHTRYHLQVKIVGPDDGHPLNVSLESNDGKTVYARGRIFGLHRGLNDYRLTLQTGALTPSTTNRLMIRAEQPGDYEFRYVSLFSPTYHDRPNGLRPDLMNLLAGLYPTFLRLPGGNYLEGDTIPTRFDWSKTIGDPAMRPGHQGPWGYRSSDGLGLLEFLEWCEDLRMQPVLAVYAGYSLRGDHVAPGADLTPYVGDALKEIEFVAGDRTTPQGKMRATLGHARPFPLTYVEVGNEDTFDRSGSYEGRFAQFYDAIKAKYPKLKVIATMPVKSRVPDVVDDHYYRSAVAMERDAAHYDGYPRSGPKIFVGEWASTEGRPTPTMNAALGDAAWLTGLERNSDVVVMEAYAPLLVNVNPGAAQWGTNLIGYDALTSFGSPSYYVQSMFGANAGDVVLPVHLDQPAPAAAPIAPHGAVGVGTWRTNAIFRNMTVSLDGVRMFPKVAAEGEVGWTPRRGTWTMGDGFIQQTSPRTDTQATNGETEWTNYSFRLQARKVSGEEGFLVQFHVHDGQFWQWNVGGWNDTRTALQRVEDGSAEEVGKSVDVTIKPGRWYDLRVDVLNGHISCYLDGALIQEADETPRPPVGPLFATSSRDLKTGDVILKLVNVSGIPHSALVALKGLDNLTASLAQGWQLSGQPLDQNSVPNPKKVAPKPIQVAVAAPTFPLVLPPYSVTVLRVPTRHGDPGGPESTP
jgi:alpha-N-arabinofuranosidase